MKQVEIAEVATYNHELNGRIDESQEGQGFIMNRGRDRGETVVDYE